MSETNASIRTITSLGFTKFESRDTWLIDGLIGLEVWPSRWRRTAIHY